MKWYHFSVEYFEDLRNVNHCEFLVMRKSIDSGKYILENKLRTWSELKRERALALKEKEREKSTTPSQITTSNPVSDKDKEKEKRLESAQISPAIPTRKRWGGCPNGCDHGQHSFRKENSMHAMQLNGKPAAHSTLTPSPLAAPTAEPTPRRSPRWQSSSEEDSDDPRGRIAPPGALDVHKAREATISSPNGTPSFISVEDRIRHRVRHSGDGFLLSVGRDFGGSASGHTSVAGSETEEEDSSGRAAAVKVRSLKRVLGSGKREESGMGRGALADALGDQSDVGSDAGSEFDDLESAEKEDKGLRGSVY